MASVGQLASKCIEISSDEESEGDLIAVGLSNGLSRNTIIELFKSFTRKCTQNGLSKDTISCAWNIFEKASTDFLLQDGFISFLRAAAERLNKGNVKQLVTSVCQCLCTESVNDSVLTSLNYSQARPSTRKTCDEITPTAQLEAAKGKLIEFISKQCIARNLIKKQPEGKNQGGLPKSVEKATITSVTKEQQVVNLNLTTDSRSNKIALNGGQSDIGGVKNAGSCATSKMTGCSLVSSPNVMTHQLTKGTVLKDQMTVSLKTVVSTSVKAAHLQTPPMKKTCVTPAPVADGAAVKEAKGNDNIAVNGTEDDDSDDIIFVSVTHHTQPLTKKSTNVNAKQEVRPKPPAAMLARACNPHVSLNNGIEASKESKRQKKKKLIMSMKARLKFYDNEIKRLAQAELSLDEMDNADSSYIRESKMKEKYARLHKKLCMLQGSDDLCDEQPYAGVRIIGCPYPEINREAEKYLRSKRRFPDFFEIKKIVVGANKNYSIGLKSQEEVDIAREVFSEIGDKLQRRRKKEFSKYSGSFLTDKVKTEADPALHNPHLKKQLKTNKKISKQKTEDVFKHYSRLQYKGCDTNTISSDDEEIAKQVIETQNKISPGPIRKRVRLNTTLLAVNGVKLEKVQTGDDNNVVVNQQKLDLCSNGGKDVEKNQWVGNSCVPKRLFQNLSTQSLSKPEETKVVYNSVPKTALQNEELTFEARNNIGSRSSSKDGSLTKADNLRHTQSMQSKLGTNQRNTPKFCPSKVGNASESSFSGANTSIMNGQVKTSSKQSTVRQPFMTSIEPNPGCKPVNRTSTGSFKESPLTSNDSPKLKLQISDKMEKALKRVKPALVNYWNGDTSPLSKNQVGKNGQVNVLLERADAGFGSGLRNKGDSVGETKAIRSKQADSSSKIIIIDLDSD